MGKFRITLEDGSKYIITTEDPTTSGVFGDVPTSEFERGERNIAGNIGERPGAAIRGGLLSVGRGEGFKEGFTRGAVDPSKVSTFQEEGAKMASRIAGILPRPLVKPAAFAGSVGAQAIGFGADIATNPFDLLLTLAGQSPGAKKAGALISKTKPAQAVGRFLTKERGIAGRGLLRKGLRAGRKFRAEPKTPIKETITKQIQATKQARTQALNKVKDKTTKKIFKAADRIDDEVLKMADDLQRSAETGSLEFQKRIPQSQRAASNKYGEIVDDISDELVKRGEGISVGDMRKSMTDTLSETQELALPEGRADTVIKRLFNEKYTVDKIDDIIPLQEVLNDTKLIKGQASSGVKAGVKPFSDDEIAIAIFNKNFGKILEAKAPAIKELNKAYAPVIRVNKAAHKLFKPRAGELQTKAGTGLIKRAATKKVVKGKVVPAPSLERGERELIRILEEGTEFSKGIGKVTESTTRIGERIAGREVAKVKAGKAITKAGKVKEQKILADFNKKLNSLAKREAKIEQLLRNKAKVDKIRKLVLAGAISVGAAVSTIRAFLGLERTLNR